MTASMPSQALDLVKSFEGYHKKLSDGRAAPYLCPAKVATIGFGTTYYEGGRKVSLADPPIDRSRAEALLSRQLLNYLAGVDNAIKVPIHQLMRGACGSLSYNIGQAAFRRSTAARMINQQRWNDVPRAWKMWRMGGGRVLAGLERRRVAELALFTIGLKEMQAGRTSVIVPPIPSRKSHQPGIWQRFLEWLFGDPAPVG